MSARKRGSEVRGFLVQEGYLFAFAFVCLLCLLSYFVCNNYFTKYKSREVLGTSIVKGVWIKSSSGNECYGIGLVDANGCIDSTYFDKYEKLPIQQISLNEYSEIVFVNESFLVTGTFDVKEIIDDEVWDNLQIGSLSVKVNNRQWIFENVVWKEESNDSLISLVKIDNRYLIIIHPAISLTGRDKQFLAFEYLIDKGSVRSVYFSDSDGKKAFVESTYVEVLEKDNDAFVKFEYENPALMGNKEILLYKYNNTLELVHTFILEE